MTAGQLNRKVRFDARQSSTDKYGNDVAEWAAIVEDEPAQIRPLRGSEDLIAARITGRQIVEIKVRYSARTVQVTTDHRAVNVATGETYNIRSIENRDERGRYLTMLCESGVANG